MEGTNEIGAGEIEDSEETEDLNNLIGECEMVDVISEEDLLAVKDGEGEDDCMIVEELQSVRTFMF